MDDRSTSSSAETADSCDVLVVVTSTARRGAEVEAVDLAGELRAAGLCVRVVALTTGANDVQSVDALGPTALGLTTLRRLRAAAGSARMVIAYGSTTLPACAIALSASRTPFIYRSIGDPGEWLRGRVHRFRTKMLFRQADHVVALWPGACEDIHRLHAVPNGALSVIPNARNADRFRPPTPAERAAARSAQGIDDDRAIVVSLGALSPEKQTEHSIRAMDDLPDAHLLVVGDGPQRRTIDELARHANAGNVSVVGPVDDPLSVLHAADALLLASRTEGMPGVIIEAGLCGVPAVAPPVGAIADLIEHGVSGCVATSDDPADLAAGLRTTLSASREFGDAAATRMRDKFVWDVVTPRWTDLLERLQR